MRSRRSPSLALLAFVTLGGGLGSARADDATVRFFETDVVPILRQRCLACHGGEAKIRGGLRLTSRESILKGGDTGPAVSVEAPAKSLLLEAIRYEGLEMPPTGKLPAAEIALLTKWVEQGAPWSPKVSFPAPVAETPKHGPPAVTEETKRFWSFRRVTRPAVPAAKDAAWVRTPIDAFVRAKLEAAGLSPSAPASNAALLRRATYDLTGLPPSPDDVAAFVADESSDAYERAVDRLLESPHYGERQARHWMDLVRYAESNSYERDHPKPEVWRYRDWLIRAFNDDKPYDRFVREQLAGDELPDATTDSLIATGYYRLGIWDDEPTDETQALYDDLDDVLSTTGQAFLGLTVGCARCHDHKLDPFPQRDYYRLLAFFGGVTRYADRKASPEKNSLRPIATPESIRREAADVAAHQKQVAENAKTIAAFEKQVEPLLSDVEKEEFRIEGNRLPVLKTLVPAALSAERFAEYERLVAERTRLRNVKPQALDRALCVTEIAKTRETHIHVRGNPQAKGERVEPGFPSVLSPPDPQIVPPDPLVKSSGRRRALADWIASPENPLTARVMANRIWQQHFGRGLVRSSNNFGLQGTRPTHPELLDWLAAEFVSNGWRLKPLHRLILTSNAYRQSSAPNAVAAEQDPENDLLWRFDMRGLSAEEVRDSILAVDGSLNRKRIGGPSVYPVVPPEVLAGQSRPGADWGKSSPEDAARRSVYVHVKRSLAVPILESFDAADTDNSCPVRFATTQPTQALGLLNSRFLGDAARTFARFARASAGEKETDRIRFVLSRVLQREPTPVEIDRGRRFVDRLRQEDRATPETALDAFCLLALNLNEFLYLD